MDFWKADGERRRSVLTGCLLALATIGVYWQVHAFEFTRYDEFFMIVNNPIVRAGLTLDGVRWALTTSWFEYWHPVTWLSLMLDCQLFGLNSGAHHLVNLGFHIADTLLVFLVLRRLTGAHWRSALVAGLFALHPLHVESVAWAAERKDTLSALFFLLTIGAYGRYVEKARAQHPGRNAWYIAALGFFALGLMSKPMLITLPFVLLLLDYWPLARLDLRRPFPLLREKLPFFVLTFASTAISYWGVKAGGNILSEQAVPWSVRLGNVPVSYARYLIKLVWPTDLAILYPMPAHLAFWQVAGALLLVGGISLWALLRARSAPYLLVGWFTFLGVLVPTIGLVQAGGQAIADRYSYIPSIGLFVAVVWGLADWARRGQSAIHPASTAPVAGVSARRAEAGRPEPYRGLTARERWAAAAAVLALAACGVTAWHQAGYWRNGLALWTHCVEVTGEGNVTAVFHRGYARQLAGRVDEALEDYRKVLEHEPARPLANLNDYLYANLNLGAILIARGHLSEATNYFRRALEIRPEEAKAHADMGLALRELGDYPGALTHCAEAIRLDPGEFGPFFDMGMALSALGRSREAADYFVEARRRNPGAAQIHYYLGTELLKLGQADDAATSLSEAVRLAPDWPDAHFELGVVLAAKGDPGEAVGQYREALRLKPDLTVAKNNLAWILATSPEAKVRDGAQAVELAEQACDQSAWRETVFVGTLSAAYAEAGRFEQAVAASQKACDLARSLGQTNLLERNRELLLHFEHREPYRQGN